MAYYRSSIRQKIQLGYVLVVVMIVGLSAFTLIELNFLEKKVMFGEAIGEFFDVSLEIRRFEKNYFLYGQRSDLEENLAYVSRAQHLLEANATAFAAIATAQHIDALSNGLMNYAELMGQYGRIGAGHAAEREQRGAVIRRTGKDIITVAEELSKAERRSLQALLASSRRFLIFSIGLLVLLIVVIGQVLARVVVKPLKLMQHSMELIADGRFDNIRIDSHDREVVSLTRAFNKMLKELELRQRHLVQSEKLASLGTLLSGVAHELNNPLSNISTSSQILAEEMKEGQEAGAAGKGREKPIVTPFPDPDFAMQLVSQVNEQTDRARNIVRSLLEFSRDKEFTKQTLPLRQLVEETLRFLKGQTPPTVSVTVDIPEDLTVSADKQRIQQALLNLIRNAIEAIPGEGAVAIRARAQRAMDKLDDETSIYNYLKYRGKCTLEEDTVDIEVRDSGTGIPQDILPRVFDPFFTTKDVGKGSGLGLFIVHEIIEEHDGCIAVNSEPGKGTSFIIRLPVK